MAVLKEASQAQRINKALEVLAIMTSNPKATQKKACDQVGITPDVYRKWIAQSHEAIAAFRETIQEIERTELSNLLIAKEAITEKLLADGLAKYTDPMARLAIVQYVDNRIDVLAERHRSVDTKDIQDILSGPKLAAGSNRFGATSDLVIQAEEDGSINVRAKTPVIIDVVAQPSKPDPLHTESPELHRDPLEAILGQRELPSGSL